MKKLLLVVAVGCSLSSITSAALAEGRQGPPHWPPPARGEAQETDASAAAGLQFGPLILRYGPQVQRYRPDVDYLDTLRTRKK